MATLTYSHFSNPGRRCHYFWFFDFIYIMLDVIGTCMQNFKKIDLKKNPSFFIQSCSALFLLHTVLGNTT